MEDRFSATKNSSFLSFSLTSSTSSSSSFLSSFLSSSCLSTWTFQADLVVKKYRTCERTNKRRACFRDDVLILISKPLNSHIYQLLLLSGFLLVRNCKRFQAHSRMKPLVVAINCKIIQLILGLKLLKSFHAPSF